MSQQLLGSVRFYFAQSAFNANCHFQAHNRLAKRKKLVSNFIKLISAVTLVLLVLQVIGLQEKSQDLLNLLAYIGMMITATSLVFEFFNNDKSQDIFLHKSYGEKYKALRDEYMGLIESVMSNTSPEDELRKYRDQLQKRYSAIGENAPETTSADYKKTQAALGLAGNDDEQFTWSDQEINKFLPVQLRIV